MPCCSRLSGFSLGPGVLNLKCTKMLWGPRKARMTCYHSLHLPCGGFSGIMCVISSCIYLLASPCPLLVTCVGILLAMPHVEGPACAVGGTAGGGPKKESNQRSLTTTDTRAASWKREATQRASHDLTAFPPQDGRVRTSIHSHRQLSDSSSDGNRLNPLNHKSSECCSQASEPVKKSKEP